MRAIPLLLVAGAAHADVSVGGYLEAYYQLQLQNASNRITNLRGFDDRSRTFTLSNTALDCKGETGPLAAELAFQVGSTPTAYYGNEQQWKYIQTATVTAKLPADLGVSAGLFTSPVGIEVVPIKDNMNWSRSNLFFGLPFYHTGFHIFRQVASAWTVKLHVYNGWNTVVDNNGYPSAGVSAAYTEGKATAQLLYLGGVERPTGAPEGNAWRNLFDAYLAYPVTELVTLAAQADAGVEPNAIGTSWWAAAAGYVKVALADELYAAARADYFHETTGGATAIFWPVAWVAEGTLTLAYQPVDHVSARLEYRHDHAAGNAYYGGTVTTDPTTMADIPNRRMQDTVTAGVTAWF